MELNPRLKSKKTVKNPEGSIVLNRRPEIQLYLEASNLNLKKNSFYKESNNKLKDLIGLANKQDNKYILGLSKFLADKGLKTSPVILLSCLSDKKYSFENEDLTFIFNTPRRIAESIALNNLNLVKLNNSFMKRVLKKSLEDMQEHTLKKNKMKRNKIKLRDLIKLLHPHPKDDKMNKLYKAIIENSKEASLSEKEGNMISIKSSTKLTKEEKKEEISKNIDSIPINQLIRNLKFLSEEYDFEKNIEVQKKVLTKLKAVKNYRFLNVFDIITAAVFVPAFEKLLDEIVKGFISEVEFKFDGDATILFDISGSMLGEKGKDHAFKGFLYLALFSKLFNIELRTFSDNLHKKNKVLDDIIVLLKKGLYSQAYDKFQKHAESNRGGTALIESATELINEGKVSKNLIIISDEVSWKEGENLLGKIEDLSDKIKDKNLIVINPAIYNGTVFKKNIVAVSSLNPSILIDMSILVDEERFIKYIRSYDRVNR